MMYAILPTMITNSNAGPLGADKWGAASLAGFQPVPDVLLMKQQELDLEPLDLLVLLNLTSYWWYRDQPPFPRTNIIATRTGVSSRSVQRVMKKLQAKGYIKRRKWKDAEGNVRPAVFFDGLIDTLSDLASADPILARRMRKASPRTDSNPQSSHSSAKESARGIYSTR
jgi:hypothetical protein